MDKKRGERPRSEGGRRGGRWKRNEEAEAVVENISRILLFLRASSVTMHCFIDRRRRVIRVRVML
jgi:hypothetical protein